MVGTGNIYIYISFISADTCVAYGSDTFHINLNCFENALTSVPARSALVPRHPSHVMQIVLQ